MAHMARGYVKFDTVKHLILDEADRMLDIGFYDDIIKIIDALPAERQSLMFSATMASKIRKLAKEILSEPEENQCCYFEARGWCNSEGIPRS
jgi:superfamily II DNA/RNA helicase